MKKRIIIIIILTFLKIGVIFSQEKKKKIILNSVVLAELDSMFKYDQKYRALMKSERNLKKKDSLWTLQEKIDVLNTQKLVSIVKKYGYIDSGNSNTNVGVYAMFMHTPNKFIKEVRKLIESERIAQRVDDSSYGLIMWHLNGRKDLPFKINYYKNDSINKQ